MKPILTLSGETGGGQLLRSALALSLITGQAFRMTGIRGQRPKPGLMRQHFTCVKAAAGIGGAGVEGAEIGSTELRFSPGAVAGGDFSFAIGSGGSTTLVMQTLLPALLHATRPSTLRIEGGTHNPFAPPFEFIRHCYLPALATMGIHAEIALERPGFMQAGGGVLTASIVPVKKWRKLHLTERGEPVETFGRVLQAHLSNDIARRGIATAARVLDWPEDRFEIHDATDSAGPGGIILLGARFANVSEISSGVAQMGKSVESIASGAAKGLRGYLASSAPIGAHLADQLLVPMALAGGGEFHTLAITHHTRTNIALIEQFLPVNFAVEDLGQGVKAVRCDER